MKGFPNQVPDLGKLATAMQCIVQLGHKAGDDGVLGKKLVRAGVAGAGHKKMPVGQYIREQLRKPLDRQSFRTTARGLRELFKILKFIDVSAVNVIVTELGREAAAYAGQPLSPEQISFWRRAINEMLHDGGDGVESHPYQVFLRLVQRKPNLPKDKAPLALEARDDSHGELDRIVELSQFPETRLWQQLRASRTGNPVGESNWENAKKILPRFAEQLGDVIRSGTRGNYRYSLADAPGRADAGQARAAKPTLASRRAAPRAPRTSRAVTPETIAQAGTAEKFPEVQIPPNLNPAQAAAAVRVRFERLRRHNRIVQQLATRLGRTGGRLFEDPFDLLTIIQELGILAEIKTLDGTNKDEQDRVREALAQLLYYDAFVRPPEAVDVTVHKIACFEGQISDAHISWLNQHGIGVIWSQGNHFAGDNLAARLIGQYLEELRG